MCEKQESFLDIQYSYDKKFTSQSRSLFEPSLFEKGEADGSSFPSGGLRKTHEARAYMIRDPQSDIFIKSNNKVMYIPALLVSHHGEALDDKTIFRKSEEIMKKNVL